MKTFVSVDEAKALIAASLPAPVAETVPLAGAHGLFLADDLSAREDLPAFANSAMDGYAVRAADLRGASEDAPVSLPLAGEIRAGGDPNLPWPEETCLRILTGAPAPTGADGVVVVEDTEEIDDGRSVRFRAGLAREQQHIRPAGEDLRAGDPLLPRGTRLGPAALGLLAAQGVVELPAYRRPRVAFLATGDELVPAGSDPGPGKIRNSNGPMLTAQLAARGADPRDLGIAADDRDTLKRVLGRALEEHDVLVTSGGVSMGRYDLVGELLVELGATWVFHKVSQQPAKPLAFLTWRGKPVFGVPGNPVSGFLAVCYYVAPALGRMMGDPDPEPRHVAARLAAPLRGRPAKLFFARAWTEWGPDGYVADPRPPHGSHVLSSLARANSFVILPAGTGELAAGSEVEAVFFE